MKTAIVIGATGLVGKSITERLLLDVRYDSVKVFTRRPTGNRNPKLKEYLVDFEKIEDWKNEITGSKLYSALGTTIKKTGNRQNQYRVDFDYQYSFAKAASDNWADRYLLVSSAGANTNSVFFYLRIKGELERKAAGLPFKKIAIFQPSILTGERSKNKKRREIWDYHRFSIVGRDTVV